ncbi:hypothetical protein IWW52_006898, partial [Coemansia sp. RSA 2704]
APYPQRVSSWLESRGEGGRRLARCSRGHTRPRIINTHPHTHGPRTVRALDRIIPTSGHIRSDRLDH